MAEAGRRQFVKFNFFKVASEWRRLPDDERLDSKKEFAAVVEETASNIFTRAFSMIGLRSGSFLAKQRRYAIVVAFILGALITPTFDPVNQTIVAVPIAILYEVGIWLAKLGARMRNKSKIASEMGLDSEAG